MAKKWCHFFRLLDDFAGGFEICKVKAQATAKHVEFGQVAWWDFNGNKGADVMAKLGAWQHPYDDQLAELWRAYVRRVWMVARYVGRLAADARQKPPDTEADKKNPGSRSHPARNHLPSESRRLLWL